MTAENYPHEILVRIRMLMAADSLEAGTEWIGYLDGNGWLAIDKTQGNGQERNWRCVMPSEALVISVVEDGI